MKVVRGRVRWEKGWNEFRPDEVARGVVLARFADKHTLLERVRSTRIFSTQMRGSPSL